MKLIGKLTGYCQEKKGLATKTEDGLLKSRTQFPLIFSTQNNVEQQPDHSAKIGRDVSVLL